MQLFYENSRGQTLDLLNDPNFIMTAATGLSSLPQNNISTVETVQTEGDFVTNRRRSSRQVVLTHQFQHDVKNARRNFARILDQGAKGKLRYIDEELDVYLDVEIETCEVSNTEFPTTATTTFIANFPYWLATQQTSIDNKAKIGAWKFPFKFPVNFGKSQVGESIVIENEGDFSFGFTVRFEFFGEVLNPKITKHTGEFIEIDNQSDVYPFNEGDVLEIKTVAGEKSCVYYPVGESPQNYMFALTNDSNLFALDPGTNVLMATAESGETLMNVNVTFANPYKVV